MSSELIIAPSAAKLARKAWTRVISLVLLSLLGMVALGFYGLQLHRLEAAKNNYKDSEQQYHLRTQAIHRLSDMEAAFNRFLLDANTANLDLLQSDKQKIEQLSQQSPDAQHDQLLQNLIATEQKWNTQAVQPLVEERRKLAAGQGLPEDFLAKYRGSRQDLQVMNTELAAEDAHHQAQQALQQTEDQLHLLWLPFPIAVVLACGVIWLSIGAIKSVNTLKQVAEDGAAEDDDDGPDNNAEAK
jgi:CHASE3 domain sensor protein